VLGSANARVGMQAAVDVLNGGGSAIDASIAAARLVEDNLEDSGVGTGGTPNILGQVELDASIMDGRTLASGAVGAVKHYPNPIEIARKVMELTPHVMLVGEGAELFAKRHGFTTSELLTEASKQAWQERVARPTNGARGNAYEDQYQLFSNVVDEWVKLLHAEIFGTTNVIVRDGHGDIACAVTTSGWGYKWPGRLGDSPIIGAGNYADNRFGAAACTGRGEMAIRCNTAHSVVMYMRFGMPLDEALTTAMHDLAHLEDKFAERSNVMNIVAMDKDGNVSAASTGPDAGFVFQRTDMAHYEEAKRLHVPLG
jgi:beta-aspartyl-peptidase (threonine type)